jgi:hypothetical protein
VGIVTQMTDGAQRIRKSGGGARFSFALSRGGWGAGSAGLVEPEIDVDRDFCGRGFPV